jgi:hypothetical protein
VAVMEALQAALTCVAALPSMSPSPREEKEGGEEETDEEDTRSHSQLQAFSLHDHGIGETCLPTGKQYVMQYLTPAYRLQLFNRLAQQLETYSIVLLMYRKQEKEAEKLRAKRGGRGDQSAAGEDETTAGHPVPPVVLALPKQLGGYQTAETLNVHCVELQLSLCVFGLEEMFMKREGSEDEDEDEEEEDAEEGVAGGVREGGARECVLGEKSRQEAEEASAELRRSPSCAFLRKHLLERSLHCLELCLKSLHLQAVSSPSPCPHQGAENRSPVGGSSRGSHIVALCHHLFQCLMRVLIKLRSEDKENACELGTQHQKTFHTANNSNTALTAAGGSRRGGSSTGSGTQEGCHIVSSTSVGSLIFPSLSQHQYLYPNQLVLRCMLGCLRAENVHTFHLAQALPTTATAPRAEAGGGREDMTTESAHQRIVAQFRMERLTVLLEEGFKVGHSGSRRGMSSAGFSDSTNYTTATGLTWGTGAGTMRETESRLEKQVM